MDEIETLMPRTKAANDRAQVDRAKLKQYMVTKNTPHSVGARSGVVVRGDVRKDAEGFEDVDDFWVDDEDSMQDDSVDDDDSLTASDKEEADTSGDISEPSEHEVELPDIGSPSMSDRESMDIEAGPIPSRSVVRSLRNSGPVLREEKTAEAPPSPARSDVSFDFGGSPHGSVDMNDMNAEANVTMRDRRKKSTGKDTTKSKARRRESFGGFDDDMASPFSLNEGPVTPLSNASDRTLKSIPSYKSSLSPNISKELFKDGDYNSDVSAKKPKKKQAKGKAAKKKATSRKQSNGDAKTRRIRPTGKYGYRTNPPTTDTSIQSIQTDDDNDESFEAQNDSGGETGDDSFYNEPDAPTGPVRDRLPDASKILDGDEDDDAWDGSGLRRSKRRRFKPLAWFKSEHMVYERTFVGVGTVMPTVVGVERLGRDDSPTKRTKAKPPSKRTNNSRAFSLKDLPKDVQKRIVESEWATLFDSQAGCMNDLNIICRSSEIRLRKLPTEERGGAVVHAYAGQSFNLFSPSPFARWISGRVVLPPGAWKEPEGVGQAVQLFYVTGCQPKSLELALAPETDDDFFKSKHTTHFLLSPGDEFYVPSGNVYYVKNHSSTADCDLRFTILKPEAPAMVDDIDVEEKEEPTTEQPQDVGAESSPLKRKREDGAEADADRDSDSV